MNIAYENNRLRKQFSSATEIKRAFGNMAKKVAMRIQEMEAAPSLAVLMQVPAANCHPLKHDRAGQWAVTISVNHRLIFTIEHDPVPRKEDNSVDVAAVTAVKICGTEDYH